MKQAQQSHPTQAARPWHILAFYLVCLAGSGYAQLLATIPETGISLWLPNGLLLGALLASSRRSWILWIAAAVTAELTGNLIWFGNSAVVSTLFIVGNVAASVCGALVVGHLAGLPFRLLKISDLLWLVLGGALLAPTIAAAIGTLTLVWSEGQPWQRAFYLWWVGDATGVLVAAPAVLTVTESWRRRSFGEPQRLPEAALFVLAIGLVAAASVTERLPFGLIFLPLILMAAARLFFWGSLLGILALVMLLGLFEVLQIKPFALIGNSLESNVQQQLFLGIAAFSALVVAVLAKQNSDSLLQLTDSNRMLEQRVAERTASLATSEARLRKMMEGTQVGIAFGDRTMALHHANASLATLLERPSASLEGGAVRWQDLMAPPDREKLRSAMAQMETEGRSHPAEIVFRRASGSSVPTIFTASKLDDDDHVAFIVDQTEQKLHEEQTRLLMREVNHRAKNLLAVVQSVARQTKAESVAEFLTRFDSRLRALSALQDLLIASQWEGTSLAEVIRGQLAHFGDVLDSRVSIHGPLAQLSAAAAQTVSLAIHELATNAAKYGALSNDIGEIAIGWEFTSDSRLVLTWVEKNGPTVTPPGRLGFGTHVIAKMVAGIQGCSVRSDFAPAGLTWVLAGPTSSLLVAPLTDVGTGTITPGTTTG